MNMDRRDFIKKATMAAAGDRGDLAKIRYRNRDRPDWPKARPHVYQLRRLS